MTTRRILAAAGLFAAYVGLAAVLPPLDDEMYYWCWAQDLQPSYFDHPPMTAYLIRASTALFGDSVCALRLPACVASVGVVLVIADLTGPGSLVGRVLLTPLFTFGAVLVTPDTPLLLFWALYLRWLVAAHRRLTPAGGGPGSIPVWLWAIGGGLLGAGALGKYTMALAVPAGFASFCLSGVPWRRWLPGYVGHGVVSAVMFSPVVGYNVARDFEPIRFQWDHAMGTESTAPGWKTCGEFVGVQLLLFGLLPFALFPWAVRRVRTLAADPVLRVCACLYGLPLAFFVLKSLRGPLEGNWGLVSYVGFWPVAGHWLATAGPARPRAVVAGAFLLPTAVVAGLAVHLVQPLDVYPAARDRVTRQAVRAEVARQGAEAVRAAGGGPVYTPTYQWVALLRYYGADARQMDEVSRPSHFTANHDRLQDSAAPLVWNEMVLPDYLTTGFGRPELVGSFPVDVRGVRVSGYHLLRYRKSGPAAE